MTTTNLIDESPAVTKQGRGRLFSGSPPSKLHDLHSEMPECTEYGYTKKYKNLDLDVKIYMQIIKNKKF